MDKFESKAKEILAEVKSILDRKSQGEDIGRIPNRFPNAVNEGYIMLLMKVQTVFYLYDPSMPLYLRSLKLDEVKHYSGVEEFEELKDLLEVFLEMLQFQES